MSSKDDLDRALKIIRSDPLGSSFMMEALINRGNQSPAPSDSPYQDLQALQGFDESVDSLVIDIPEPPDIVYIKR